MKMRRALRPPWQMLHPLLRGGRHPCGIRHSRFLIAHALVEGPAARGVRYRRRPWLSVLSLLRLTLTIFLVAGGTASSVVAAMRPGSSAVTRKGLEGVWAFDGRSRCRAGSAWVLKADGSYSDIRLPDPTARGRGQWVLRGNTVFYSLALPGGSAARPLTKRMVIIEYSPNRLVAIAGRKVRHVMYRCP